MRIFMHKVLSNTMIFNGGMKPYLYITFHGTLAEYSGGSKFTRL